MVSRIIKVDPFDLVVFGGTGDLAYRKLYPALFHRFVDGQLAAPTRIVGASRRALALDEFRAAIRDSLVKHGGADAEKPADIDAFLAMVSHLAVDAAGEAGWPDLKSALNDPGRIRAFYLATAPDLFGGIAARLAGASLITPLSRIIVEKPIGKDGASANIINDQLGAVFAESQIYRIDHYLGKETVQNLMALRFGNILFEPLWNSAHIDHVQITASETIGVEGRGAYYDTSGALRDMVQNHLLQLLCLVAMEPPARLQADAVRDEKLKVLKSLARIDDSNVAQFTVRGQYKAGAANGAAVPGYLEECGNAASTTETFVAIKAGVSNWRWAGVPFYLRTGKRLPPGAALHFRIGHRRARGKSPRHPPAAGRRHQTMADDQGARPWRLAAAARAP